MYRVRFLAVLALMAGCGGRGWAPVWSQASPETSFEAAYDPMSATYRFQYYDSMGRSLTADELSAECSDGKKSFKAKGLKTSERSVENRLANVQQMDAGTRMTDSAFEGANKIFGTLAQAGAPLVAKYLQGRQEVAMMKAQKPQLIEQLTGLVTGGVIDHRSGVSDLGFPAEWQAEVDRRVEARIAELKLATSQPTTAPSPGLGQP